MCHVSSGPTAGPRLVPYRTRSLREVPRAPAHRFRQRSPDMRNKTGCFTTPIKLTRADDKVDVPPLPPFCTLAATALAPLRPYLNPAAGSGLSGSDWYLIKSVPSELMVFNQRLTRGINNFNLLFYDTGQSRLTCHWQQFLNRRHSAVIDG